MLITALTNTSPERYTIAFDDGSEIRSTLGVVTDLRLFVGKDVSVEDASTIREHSLRALFLERSIEILSRRQMSEKELEKKLLEKGADASCARYCISRLVDMGFLNDERYAGAVARHYSRKGYGAGRVRAELARRGISREFWEDALQEMVNGDDKLDSFLRARLSDPEDRDQVRKVTAALFRRGYSWDQIRSALSRYSEEDNEIQIIEEDP